MAPASPSTSPATTTTTAVVNATPLTTTAGPTRRLILRQDDDDEVDDDRRPPSSVRWTSNVVGAVPSRVHQSLNAAVGAARGRADDCSSGSSFLIVPAGGYERHEGDHKEGFGASAGEGRVLVWEHSTQTPSEDLAAPPESSCVELIHPEYPENSPAPLTEALVAVFRPPASLVARAPSSSSVTTRGRAQRQSLLRREDAPGATLSSSSLLRHPPRHAYVGSPSGVVCLWILDGSSRSGRRRGRGGGSSPPPVLESDAHVRLPLRPGEELTALVPLLPDDGGAAGFGGTGVEVPAAVGNDDDPWIMAGTSFGRIYKIAASFQPLGLRARAIRGGVVDDEDEGEEREGGDGGEMGAEGSGVGIIGGLYGALFGTTSENSNGGGAGASSPHGRSESGEDDGSGPTGGSGSGIAALIPLPSCWRPSTEGGGEEGQREKKSAGATVSSSAETSRRYFLSLTTSLALTAWKMTTAVKGGVGAKNGEGRLRRGFAAELFPRLADGTIDLSPLEAIFAPHGADGGDDEEDRTLSSPSSSLRGYHAAELIAAPRASDDGRSIVLVIRIGGRDGGERGGREGNGTTAVDGSARAYILRVAVGGGRGGVRGSSAGSLFRVADAARLDRYSGESLSSSSLSCAGLAIATVEEDGGGMGGEGGAIVAYVAFGPGGGGGAGAHPVTVSAARFSLVGRFFVASLSPPPPAIVADVDLRSDVVPSIMRGSPTYDASTGGCVFLATSGLLGGALARFPSAASSTRDGGGVGTGSIDEREVATLRSHLRSSFRQYKNLLLDGGNPAAVAQAVVPPSVLTALSPTLSEAAVVASLSILRGSGSGYVGGASSPSRGARDDALALHADYINFLVHAGAYRRVSATGRARLRDHGEAVVAARASRGVLSADGRLRHAAAEAWAAGAPGDAALTPADLPLRWAELQRRLLFDGGGGHNDGDAEMRSAGGDDDDGLSSVEGLLLTSSAICAGINAALRYRGDESETLYDLPSGRGGDRPSVIAGASWISSPDVLSVLRAQLERIADAAVPPASAVGEGEGDVFSSLRNQVVDMSAALLEGSGEAVRQSESGGQPEEEADARQAYQNHMVLAVPLLRRLASDGDDRDLVALRASTVHSYFGGILEICHARRSNWLSGGGADDRTDPYDLRPMLRGSLPPHAHLHRGRDFETGHTFCEYVLRWHADRNLFYDVLELAKHCPPDAFARCIQENERLRDYSWIHGIRTGSYGDAASRLVGLTSSMFDRYGGREAPINLVEREQMMSLAKLANKIARAEGRSTVDDSTIQHKLDIFEAQRHLRGDNFDEHSPEMPMLYDDLILLAVEKIKSSTDVDEIKRCCLCGLAVAGAADHRDAAIHGAALVWEACVIANIDVWNGVVRENDMGLSDEDLRRLVSETAFVSTARDYTASLSSGGGATRIEVGYAQNEAVRGLVNNSLGQSCEMSRLLMISSQLAKPVGRV